MGKVLWKRNRLSREISIIGENIRVQRPDRRRSCFKPRSSPRGKHFNAACVIADYHEQTLAQGFSVIFQQLKSRQTMRPPVTNH
ncbi:hypothetical protein SK128_014869 [Halocaridina rubra]|uniref:Uncharacterized protein n=1 Tax=Halocaridina rubra TaxID=373956 RepID=A0AAN9AD88_HALRR